MAQKFQPYLCCLHEYDTNKILKDEIITKEDDPFAQRHENLGNRKDLCLTKKKHDLGSVLVNAHAHDRICLSIST